MRVTAVDMFTETFKEPITFNLLKEDPDAEYYVRQILGLDAEDIVSNFYAWSISGEKRYFNFNLKPRNIVMRIVLNPRFHLDENYADVRDNLYRSISANRTGLIDLHFRSGATTVAHIIGSLTKFEAVHFTNLPEVQLTFRCSDPLFKGVAPVHFDTEDLDSIEPVRIPDSLSTAPHGFIMQATFVGSAESFTIQDVEIDPEWKFKVIPAGGFLAGDVLYFSSENHNKQLYYTRSLDVVYLADKVEPGSIWPILFPGQNQFHFVDLASVTLDSVDYNPCYWGV